MYKALEISKWFLAKNNAEHKMNTGDDEYEGISPLKMQKLLYYAQGIHLALNNTPLFAEPILAWPHGPVVNDVYQHYKSFGGQVISHVFTQEDETILDTIENDPAARESLELTYANFAIYTAWQLRNMTHEEGSPWDAVFNSTKVNCEIEQSDIKEYFLNNVIEN